MGTPPPPSFATNGKNLTILNQSNKVLDRTAKTPFQSNAFYQRSFKSEIQPKASSRFHQDINNAKTNTRFYPATSQRQNLNRNTSESKTPQGPKSYLVSRLGNLINHKLVSQTSRNPGLQDQNAPPRETKLPVVQHANSQQSFHKDPKQASLNPPLTSLKPIAAVTPAASFRYQPVTQLKTCTKDEAPETRHLTAGNQTRLEPPKISTTNPHTKPQLNLIQDTRVPNQQVAPPQTATKAPLSVSQYTQPTPLHNNNNNNNNKSAHHMYRAHSEPSIKYQVKVNDKTYKILRKIGSGGSAKVYEGFEPQTSQSVAIKIINIAQADKRAQDSYFNEKCILTKLRDSRHVVRMYDSEYKSDCKELVIVMEKGEADLSQVIESHFRNRDKVIDGIFIKFYWRGMVMAVNDIHQRGIVHADLKPVNFILVKNEIKLIDFGIADTVGPDVTSIIRDYQIGTINYMAPEALKNRANDLSFQQTTNSKDALANENNQQRKTVIKYNSKVDIWSLGCILYNLVYGRPPFDKYKDIVSKAQAITDPEHKIHYPEISNHNLLNCMRSCLRYKPADRPTTQELLNDPYLMEDILIVHR